MATRLQKYTVQEKLNKMSVILTDVVVPTVDTSAYANGDLMFNPIVIPNVVNENGGTGILQSIVVTNDDELLMGFDIVFTTSDDPPGTFNNAIASETGLSDANAEKTLGVASIQNLISVGTCSIGSSDNIGLVIKAEDDSRDIYCYGIARGTSDPTDLNGYNIRFGIIQD